MSVDISTLGIEVKSDGVATASNRLSNLTQEGGRAEKSVTSLSASTSELTRIAKLAAEAFAAWKLAKLIEDCILLAARVETLGVVMKAVGNNAGYGQAQMEGFAQGIAKMGITTEASRVAAVKLVQAHVDMAKSADLARIAQDAAVIANTNSSDAFERMTTGIATGQAIILHHMGLMVNFEHGYKVLADTLGKTSDELTEAEKTTARVNEVIKAGAGISGSYAAAMETAGKQLQSLPRYFQEIKLAVGEPFTEAFSILLGDITRQLKEMQKALKDNKSELSGFGSDLTDAYRYVRNELGMVAGDLDRMGANLTKTAEIFFKIAELATRFTTLGQFGDSLRDAADRQSKNSELYASRYRQRLADDAAYQASKVTGPTLDPSEAMRLKMMKESAEQTKIANRAKEEGDKKTNETLMQSKEEYGRSLRESHEGYLAYLAEWDKRVEAQAKNARELELNVLKNQKDQLLISEREYGKKLLAAKVAEATAAKAVEDRQYQEAVARAAVIEAALKKQKDGTYADGYLPDGSRVGVQQYNEANKAAEAARIQKEAADARLAAAQQDQTAYSKTNAILDERAQKELDIQALSAQGLTLAAERMANELKYADLMQKTGNAELVRRAKEVDDIKLANDLYAHQLALKQALDTLKSQNNMAAASMVGVNDKGEFGSIADQTANALAVQQAEHAARMKMIEDEQNANLDALMSGAKAYKDYTDTKNELDRKAALTERENTLKTAKIHSDAVKSQLSVTAMYAGMASDLFTSLAQTQDESSRSGFESAKQMNLAAAIASTAAAVMNQMAGGDPYTAFARAAAAGALGAIQIAKIASTTYGGGGGVAPVSSGSFAASGGSGASGPAVGAQIRSVQDTQTEQSLRRLADASDNASLAIGKVANGLTSVADLFKTGYAKNTGAGLASGGYDSPSDMWVSEMANIKGTIKDGLGGLTGDLGSLFKSIGNTIIAPLNFLKNGIFGGSWYISGAGISLGVQGGMFSGQSYTERTKDGGWFSGDKHRTDYSSLDAGAQEVFSEYIAQIKSAIARAAVSTGTSTAFASAQVAAMNISTAGRSAEDIEKDLTEFFNTAANELAKTTSGLEQFSFYGENAFDALIRLSTSLQGVNEQLSLIGHTLIDSTLQGADLAYRLADAFGGLDKMQEATDNYLSAMYSDHEREALKAAAAQREVNVAFAEMGRVVPQTREDFRALVGSLNLASDSATYVSLMNIAEAFGTVQEAADNAARDMLESQRDLQSRWLHATADAEADLYDLRIQQEQEIQDYITKGLDTTRLLEVQAREYANALSAKFKTPLIEAATSAANAIKSIMGGNLSTLSPEQQYKAQQEAFANALANGQTSQLGTLGQSLLASSKSYYGSSASYSADYDMVMKALANVAGISDPTLEAAQKQVDLLQRISDNTSLYVTATTTLAQLMSQQLGIPVGLPHFANGGITRSMALAGEAGPEAVIPLPDGRTVPVTMKGGNDALIAEIKALREEVSELRKQSVGKLTDIEAPLRRVAARG